MGVILQSHYQNRRSASKILENRATSADCRPTSSPILADILVGRRLFCRSTKVKSFVDRSADFPWFCHRWSVGRWSPDYRTTFWRNFHHDIGQRSPDHRASIGRRSPDDRSMQFYQRIIRRRISAVVRPMVALLSADHKMWFVFYSLIMHVSALFIYEIKSCIYVILGFILLDLVCKYHLFYRFLIELFVWNYVSTSPKKIET